jgi:hypothetical protein
MPWADTGSHHRMRGESGDSLRPVIFGGDLSVHYATRSRAPHN